MRDRVNIRMTTAGYNNNVPVIIIFVLVPIEFVSYPCKAPYIMILALYPFHSYNVTTL